MEKGVLQKVLLTDIKRNKNREKCKIHQAKNVKNDGQFRFRNWLGNRITNIGKSQNVTKSFRANNLVGSSQELIRRW